MKLAVVQNEVITGGLQSTGEFRVKQSAKMYSVLMDKMYTDKPRAIIREISANALDANRMTGFTRPFDVVLPTRTEPSLYIRDYGPGLSEEQVMNLYTTFFESTKTDSNDYVGALGLGSKSPFAYSDAFTVTSYHGGQKMVFAAFKNSEGIPQIALTTKEPSNTPTGLEICVPVQLKDFYSFQRAAETTLRYFESFHPGCFRCIGAQITPVKYSIETPNWAILDNTHDVSYIRMGPIAYAVDWNAFSNQTDLFPRGVELRMPIGSVDILPSREGLSLDETTQKNIRAAFRELKADYTKTMSTKIADCKTFWEANVTFNDLNANSVIKTEKAVWNGIPIDGYIRHQIIVIDGYHFHRKTPPSKLTDKSWDKSFQPRKYHTVVFNDLKDEPGSKQRLYTRLKEHQRVTSKTIVYIEDKNGIGNPPDMIDLSKIVMPVHINAKTGKRENPVIWQYNRNRETYGRSTEFSQTRDNFTVPDGSYWLPLKGTQCEAPGYRVKANLPSLRKQDVYGFSKRAQEDLDLDEHINLIDYVADRMTDLLADQNLMKELTKLLTWRHFNLKLDRREMELVKIFQNKKTGDQDFDDVIAAIAATGCLQDSLFAPNQKVQFEDLVYGIDNNLIDAAKLPVVDSKADLLLEFLQKRPFFARIVQAFELSNDHTVEHLTIALKTAA